MGHYKRKPYKKKSNNKYQKYEIINDFIEEYKNNEGYEHMFDRETVNSDDTNLLNEPDIVKELRQEERLGKLPILLFDSLYGEPQTTLHKNIQDLELQETAKINTNIPKNYYETLECAKKAMEGVMKKNNIIFLDE